MKKKQKTLEMQIKQKVREGRAPPCAVCGGQGLAGADIGPVFCGVCGANYQSLTNAWKCAMRRSIENPGVQWWMSSD